MIEIILPLPVTLNKLTHNNSSKNGGKGGRSTTKRAKDWYKTAQYYAMPYFKENKTMCNQNIKTLGKVYNVQTGKHNLHKLQTDHMDLSYHVEYHYWFAQKRHKLPRDIFNYYLCT